MSNGEYVHIKIKPWNQIVEDSFSKRIDVNIWDIKLEKALPLDRTIRVLKGANGSCLWYPRNGCPLEYSWSIHTSLIEHKFERITNEPTERLLSSRTLSN